MLTAAARAVQSSLLALLLVSLTTLADENFPWIFFKMGENRNERDIGGSAWENKEASKFCSRTVVTFI